MAKIYWAGDSTIKNNTYATYPQTGIGQALPYYLKADIEVCNFAENGRSTKSFIDEGRLGLINNLIQKNDFLFISFGHNDEKSEDPLRYTTPYGSYQDNLKLMIDTARQKGAYPVLITPLYRRLFDENGQLIRGSHLEYPEAMQALAERESVPCVDLCGLSYDLIAGFGPEKSKDFFMNFAAGQYDNYPDGSADNTHLRFEGAVMCAGLIAGALKRLGGVYRELTGPAVL